MRCLLQYFHDWYCLRGETIPIVHRRDASGGEYFWATRQDAKEAIASIKQQLKEKNVPYRNARFGGLFVPQWHVARTIYEALMKQGGYMIATHARLGGRGTAVTIIDT